MALSTDVAVGDPGHHGLHNAERAAINTVEADLVKVDISAQTGSYTTVLADAGKVVRVNSATAVTVTVPPASSVAYVTGTIIGVRQAGAGQVTVAAGSGVTINTAETLVLQGQWSEVSLHYVGSDVWDLAGDTVAA